MSRQAAPISLEYILLGLLAHKPLHGYDLYKQLRCLEAVWLVWNIKQSRLYALLEKLEQGGLLAAALAPGDTYPPRKEYRLTAAGRETFEAWRASPVSHGRDMRQEFLAKLYFAGEAGPDTALKLVDNQKEACLGWLSARQKNYHKLEASQHYEQMVYQFRIAQIQASLDWLEYCRAKIMSQNPSQ